MRRSREAQLLPLLVKSFAAYYTGEGGVTGPIRDAQDFIKAIKGLEIRGIYARIPILGRFIRITRADASPAVDGFARWAAGCLEDNGPYILIAIPPGSAVVGTAAGHRTDAVASKIADASGGRASMLSLFRWQTQMPSTRDGGTRDPRQIFQNLTCERVSRPAGQYVLIDDVFTTGGHLRACAAKLHELELMPALALCAGRTCHEPPADPFAGTEEEIEDFDPRQRA